MTSSTIRVIAPILAACAAAGPAGAAAPEAVERLGEARAALEALVRVPDDAIPEYILARAEAIVVIPTLIRGGLVIGAEHGRGVMSTRVTGGGWSAPAFVVMSGGSVGWQIGAQAVDLVLVVMNREGVSPLLEHQLRIGAGAGLAAGPVGRQAQAATDATLASGVLAYSRAQGLFAGLTLEGAALRDDREANRQVYGEEISHREIFAGRTPAAGEAGPAINAWREALARVTRPSRR